MARIFLCYDSEDKPRVRDIYRRLREAECQPWLDEEALSPGQSWIAEIPSILHGSDLILLIISQHTLDDDGDLQGDLRRALDTWEGILRGVNPTLVVRLDQSEIPDRLKRFQWVNYADEHEQAELVQAIHTLLDRHPQQQVVTSARELPPDTVSQKDGETKAKSYDIFMSYARENLGLVELLVRALQGRGLSVWWDRNIPIGSPFDKAISAALEASKYVVVVWSKASVESPWVKEEAEWGKEREILIPVRIDDVKLPLGFRRLQTADLSHGNDPTHDQEFNNFVQAIAARIASPQGVVPNPVRIEKVERPMGEDSRLQTADLSHGNGPTHDQEFDNLVQATADRIASPQGVVPRPQQVHYSWKKMVIGLMLVIAAISLFFIVRSIITAIRSWQNSNLPQIDEPAKKTTLPIYSRSYAVVIGIDKYSDSSRWPAPGSAVADALAMASFLEDRGFMVTALYDDRATRQAILQAQDDLAPQVTPEDRVLVFFAGHGHSTKPVRDEVLECLIPYDGTEDSGSYISIGQLRNVALKLGKAKHQLFFLHTRFDSLPYAPSGSTNPIASHDVEDVTQRIARQILVSGVLPSPAPDSATPRSPFVTAILEALQGEQADANDDCYIIVPELVEYLRYRGFPTLTLSTLPYHDGGEFAFRVARPLTPEQVETRLRDKTRSLCGLNLQRLDLHGRDLSGRNLREADLSNANLRQAILKGADLRRAKLAKANLRGAMLQEAWLIQADLEEADLVETDLRGAYLNKADLHKVHLQRAQLQGAKLSEARLTEADLIEANLFGAELHLANLSNAWLKDAKLNKAKLGRAILRGALLRGTDLSEADLRDADVEDMQYEPPKYLWPQPEGMRQANHLDKMTCGISSYALGELRDQFIHLRMHEAAQQITSAITRCEARLKTLRQ